MDASAVLHLVSCLPGSRHSQAGKQVLLLLYLLLLAAVLSYVCECHVHQSDGFGLVDGLHWTVADSHDTHHRCKVLQVIVYETASPICELFSNLQVDGATVVTTLTISVVWIIYSMIPPYLLIHYTWIGRGTTLQFMCRVAFVLSFVTSICAMLLLWAVYPKDYDFGAATKVGGPCPLPCVCPYVAVSIVVLCSPPAVSCDVCAVSDSRLVPLTE